MKNLIWLTLLCASCSVDAATVLLDSFVDGTDPSTNDYIVRDESGVNLSSGYVGVGVFAGLTDVQVASSDYATLLATGGFVAFATDDFVTGAANAYGGSSPGVTYVSGSFDSSSYVGESIYIFIGNGATLESSTQFALLISDQDVDFEGAPDSNNLRFSTSVPVYGSYSAGTYDGTPYGLDSSVSAQAVNLVVVPEPSAALLGGLGALALLCRRRVA